MEGSGGSQGSYIISAFMILLGGMNRVQITSHNNIAGGVILHLGAQGLEERFITVIRAIDTIQANVFSPMVDDNVGDSSLIV